MRNPAKFAWALIAVIGLLAGGCASWKPSNASGGARQPKRGFDKPAGAFKIKEVPEKLKNFGSSEEEEATTPFPGAEGGEAASEEAAPMAATPAEDAPGESRSEPAPDLAPHLKNGGQPQLITDRSAGLPGFMMAPGTASEAEVRAERLHRLLLTDPPKAASAAVVAVRVRKSALSVMIEIPVSEDPSVRELSEIARKVVEQTAKAIPEATDPSQVVEIEVYTGKHQVATWKAGAWEFAPPPQSNE